MRVSLLCLIAVGVASCGPRASGPGPQLAAIESADLSSSAAVASSAQFFVAPQSLHSPTIAAPATAETELMEARTSVTVHPMPDDRDPLIRYDDPVPPGAVRAPASLTSPAPPRDGVETAGRLSDAFRSTYQTNPVINRARSDLRAADEEVAIAKSLNRPTIALTANGGLGTERNVNVPTSTGSGTVTDDRPDGIVALEVTQPLFRGFRTRNATRAAHAGVQAERQRLRATEQDVILATAVAFLDVRRFRRGEVLRRREVDFLREQIGAASDRQRFGEGTRTDVDQATARLGEVESLLLQESAQARAAEARFREFSNVDPGNLKLDIDLSHLVPQSLSEALTQGQTNNPDIQLAMHEVDAASFQVSTLEGERLPTVSLTGRVGVQAGTSSADRTESAEVRVNVSVPIYQGGGVSARVRQAKESLGSARIGVDVARNETRSDIASSWAAYGTALEALDSARRSIGVAQRAVNGILEELRVGQRTTVDVLDAQRDLIRVQIIEAEAERQRDAAGFQLLRELGQLDPSVLGLAVPRYDPAEHYTAVADRWAGLRTPDGR